MNPYSFTLAAFGFCSFTLGLLIYWRRADTLGGLYFAWSCSISLWGVALAVHLGDNVSYKVSLFAARIAIIAGTAIPAIWYHFCCVYCNRQKKQRGLICGIYVVALLVMLSGFTSLLVPTVEPKLNFRYYSSPGPTFHIYTCIFFTIVPAGFLLLSKKLKTASSLKEKRAILGFMVASGLGYLGGGLTFLLVYDINLPQYNIFLLPIYPFVTAYAMSRENLFDIKEVVQAVQRDKAEAMSLLAASVNHEIKNPLYAIKSYAEGYLEKLKEGRFESKEQTIQRSKEILEKTYEQSVRATEIIRRFAAFAKMEYCHSSQREPLKLKDIIYGIMPLLNCELETEGIELSVKVPENMPPLKADRRQTEEILFNLIRNACQAMEGKGEIEIRAKSDENHIVIEVQDSGPGIPENQQSQIFEPFFTTKSFGTGLGLYIVKQLVEKNGGIITVESKVGQGSQFTLIFNSA